MRLTDIKRRARVGVKLTLLDHTHAASWRSTDVRAGDAAAIEQRRALLAGEGVTRTIKRVQSNGIWFDNGGGRESFLDWPRATQIEQMQDPLAFRIRAEGGTMLLYRFEPDATDAPGVAADVPAS